MCLALLGGWDAQGSFKFPLRVSGVLFALSLDSLVAMGCWVNICVPTSCMSLCLAGV